MLILSIYIHIYGQILLIHDKAIIFFIIRPRDYWNNCAYAANIVFSNNIFPSQDSPIKMHFIPKATKFHWAHRKDSRKTIPWQLKRQSTSLAYLEISDLLLFLIVAIVFHKQRINCFIISCINIIIWFDIMSSSFWQSQFSWKFTWFIYSSLFKQF